MVRVQAAEPRLSGATNKGAGVPLKRGRALIPALEGGRGRELDSFAKIMELCGQLLPRICFAKSILSLVGHRMRFSATRSR